MTHCAKAAIVAALLSIHPAITHAQTSTTVPLSGAQAQLGNCAAFSWQRLLGQDINDVELPAGTRVIYPHQPVAPGNDPYRLTVEIHRYGRIIERVYCG